MAKIVRDMGMTAVEVIFSESSEHYKGILDVRKQKALPFEKNDCVLMYGSFTMAQYLLKNHPWTPGVWFDMDALKCQEYLTHWGEHSLHERYIMLPLEEIKRQREFIFRNFGYSQIFIRPDSQLKKFSGQVIKEQDFDTFYNEAMCYGEPNTLSLVAYPQKLRHEWRTVIADRKCITGSRYIKDGEVDISTDFPDAVREFAEKIANSTEWQPHPMYVIDVCSTVNAPDSIEEMRLLEIGSLNTCGLYDCDLNLIIEKSSEIAEREWAEINDFSKDIV